MILIIDNYDSFTYNLAQAVWGLGFEARVVRNDTASVGEMLDLGATHLIVSPGPCTPAETGVAIDLIRAFRGPILGVCLGHQCIVQAYGGQVVRSPHPMHGLQSAIFHDGIRLFTGLPNPFLAARYHSLVADPDTLPAELVPTAWSDDGILMGVRHRSLSVEGVQFHPESYLTEVGTRLMENFAFTPPSPPLRG